MTTIQLDRPAPQAPAQRSWWDKADLVARIVLLAAIGLTLLSLLPVHLAAGRPAAQFSIDLKAGKVSSIDYVLKSRSLRWSDGGLRWYAADLGLGKPALGPSPDGMGAVTDQVEGNNPDNNADATWIGQAIDAAGSRQQFGLIDSSAGSWASQVPWSGFSTAAGIAVILSFFLMLGRDRRRFGTRWAWFWMFALVGWGIGPALYLLLEPAPLWFRRSRPMPIKPAFAGGAALVVALGLKAVLAGSSVGFFGLR
jgi:hypothetical protein